MDDFERDSEEKVPHFLLMKSNLSWDERQIVEYIRRNPDKTAELLEKIKENGCFE